MNIESAVSRAEYIEKVINDADHPFPPAYSNELIEYADKTIKELLEVIEWYDKNMKMLISTLIKTTKENKKLKNAIVKMVLREGAHNDPT